jgi:hypothetical protein
MSNYSIAGTDLKKLYDQSFQITNKGSGGKIKFSIPKPIQGWPRTGLEAYVIAVSCNHPSKGQVDSILKIFKQNIPERAQRTRFLIDLGLARHHPWLFQGMPYAAIKQMPVNGVQIVGHIAQHILGKHNGPSEDVFRLRQRGDWKYPSDVRKRLAGHLCCSIFALELLGVVHGDITAKNLVIGAAPDGNPAAILCDYDGFYHSLQPLLPSEYEGIPCRPLGTPGYQYPKLLEDMAANKPNVYVETDRFALAAMVCEIMIWSKSLEAKLGRETLLEDELVKTRSLSKIPADVRKLWKDGFDLLDTALKAKSFSAMPSPASWMQALGVTVDPEVLQPQITFKHRPHIEIRKRRGTTVNKIQHTRLLTQSGNFQKVAPELAQIEFSAPNGALTLHIKWKAPIYLRRAGKLLDLGTGPSKVPVQPTDVIVSNHWELEVSDEP